ATSGQAKPPARLDRTTVERLKTKARELALSSARRGASFARALLTGEVADPNLKPVIDQVRRGLTQFLLTAARAAIFGAAPGTTAARRLSPEEQKYIDQLARDAVLASAPGPGLGSLEEAALVHIRLSLNTTETINAIASELDVPGIRNRNRALHDL